MAVMDVALEVIDDNPYNPRKHYPQTKVREMANSLAEVGLRQVPEGRHVDGRVQLAYGHMRKRGYLYNQKKDLEHWKTMPVDVKEISDQNMFHFSMEENLTRTDITPIEVARCIESFSELFPDVLDKDIARKHNMTAANVSNMKRVLRMPEKFLEKIDQGTLSFTQGRELLALENLPDAENLMSSAVSNLRTGNKTWGHANTVEGLQQSIHEVVSRHFRPLDKKWEGYRWDLLFDTREVGCLKCDKMIRTHPTKSEAAHYCLDEQCWDRHQEEHREKAAAEAKAKMEAEIVKRAAEVNISQEMSEIPAELREKPDAADAFPEQVAEELEARADERDRLLEETRERANLERPVGELPCDTCAKGNTCDRTFFHVADDDSGRLICDVWECDHVSWAVPPEQREAIPEEVLAQAKEAAGTRAEVLDIHPLYSDQWRRELKGGYVLLNDVIDQLDDPQECLERCTRGFHYAFNSGRPDRRQLAVCTDPKCVAKKKAAFTRKKNAEGQAQKKAEMKAIKEAIAQTNTLDRPRIKLIFLAQMDGLHTQRYYYGGTDAKKPEKWLWDRVSAGTPENDRTRAKLFKTIDKLTDEELTKLLVEFMFYYLTDKGDIGTYEIKAAEPLKWMGIEVEMEVG